MKKIIKKFLTLIIIFIPFLSLGACEKESDDVTGTCEISRSASSSKTFLDDGIEEAELISCTDGDTSNVRTINSKRTLTIRYLSIDTPESTAGYDKWGKAASVFNKSILEKATSIIVEAEGSTAEKDTNGTRYLAYVWYKTEDNDKYRNLNLEMVENGYSNNNCSTDGKYYSYFEKAEAKAKKSKLHIHGTDEDVYYSETITNVTLKQLNESSYYDTETGIPTCVSFEAYVTGYESETSSFRTAIVEQFDETEKKYYTYKVVVGYSGTNFYTIASKGSLVKFVGWTTGSGSIHGCSTDFIMENPLYSQRVQRNYCNTLSTVEITSATVGANGATFVVDNNGTNVIITLNDTSVTQADVNALIGNINSIKCFSTGTDNSYTINLLADITK